LLELLTKGDIEKSNFSVIMMRSRLEKVKAINRQFMVWLNFELIFHVINQALKGELCVKKQFGLWFWVAVLY
jgi:hypothetical protein